MVDDPRLLVVDDEETLCRACRRILRPQGFQVEQSTDARRGLRRATEEDYSAVLLDIKMPDLDGIEFLEELRQKKPDVPVIIMTGYPSIANAAAIVRLGVSDYITKPFTPEQITQSVRRLLIRHGENLTDRSDLPSAVARPWVGPGADCLFLNESWVRPEGKGSAPVGAVLPHLQGSNVDAIRFPQVGDAVCQGLPLAELALADASPVIVTAAVSGVVVSINELLRDAPSQLLSDPCGNGWIARIRASRLEQELLRCRPRHLILINPNETSARSQCRQLVSLGCRVRVVTGWEELDAILFNPDPDVVRRDDRWYPAPPVQDPTYDVLIFDAHSFGREGVQFVRWINTIKPSLRVVVVASSTPEWERRYRRQRISYYAVAPFADRNIVQILDAAFRTG